MRNSRGSPVPKAPNLAISVINWMTTLLYTLAASLKPPHKAYASPTTSVTCPTAGPLCGPSSGRSRRSRRLDIGHARPNINSMPAHAAGPTADSQEFKEGSSCFRGAESCSTRRRSETAHMRGLVHGTNIGAQRIGLDVNHANATETIFVHDRFGAVVH